ncbi:hypothetical protein Pcinc_009269, partial [Petrolisthes cinctipes]
MDQKAAASLEAATPKDGVGNGTRTPLQEAAAGSQEKVVAALLEAGAQVEAVSSDDEGMRALHLACCTGGDRIVQQLLQAGADIHARDGTGWTALHVACKQGQAEVVQVLVAAGADIEAIALGGWQAVHRAALWGHSQVIHALLDGGADIEAKGVDDCRPIHYAAMRGHIKNVSMAEYERIGQISVKWAAEGKHTNISAHLPSRPWRLHYQDWRGWTPLHHAAYNNKVLYQVFSISWSLDWARRPSVMATSISCINPLDFYLWRHIKGEVYATDIPNREELWRCVEVIVHRLEYEKSLAYLEGTQATNVLRSFTDGIMHLLDDLRGKHPWLASWPLVQSGSKHATNRFSEDRPETSQPLGQQRGIEVEDRSIKAEKTFEEKCTSDISTNAIDFSKHEDQLTRLLILACQLGATLTTSFLV